MTLQDALAQLETHVEPGRAEGMADYHKVPRRYLGVANPAINELAKEWRQTLTVDERVTLARDLWNTDIFEARLAAAKLLTQARIRPDDAVWELIKSWLPDLDSWAIADHAMMAGQNVTMHASMLKLKAGRLCRYLSCVILKVPHFFS